MVASSMPICRTTASSTTRFPSTRCSTTRCFHRPHPALTCQGNTAVYLLYALTRIRSIVRQPAVSHVDLAKAAKETAIPLVHPKVPPFVPPLFPAPVSASLSCRPNVQEQQLAKMLVRFPEVIQKILKVRPTRGREGSVSVSERLRGRGDVSTSANGCEVKAYFILFFVLSCRDVQDLLPNGLCDFVYELSTAFSEFYDKCYVIEKDPSGKVHIPYPPFFSSSPLLLFSSSPLPSSPSSPLVFY
jgi:arginyl-tRNA synthetase